ncbi:MAG: type II toxin-antitoxin system HicB family antitoxin [Planctomycetota bacterium]|nr:type II toxin-antitoxin system HicB family antitoxin [Planctomycetota bacterium]
MDRKYLAVIEKAKDGSYSAYVPDLPGCVSSADTVEELKRLIKEAIDMYIQDMIADGEPVPEPTAQCAELPVAV